MSYFIRRPGSGWVQPPKAAYDNEAELQSLLEESPDILPIGDSLTLVKEFWIPEIGSVDLVGITSEGDVVIVECKLRANSQIRREVVGQALAYAGGIWRIHPDDFIGEFENKAGAKLSAVLESLGTKDPADAIACLRANLESGEFRIIIAVDEITSELRTIVEYLNSHTSGMDVVLLELNYSCEGDVEILVPTTYGAEAAESKRAPKQNKKRWRLADVRLAAKEDISLTNVLPLITRLLDHAESNGCKFGEGSGQSPGLGVYYLLNGEPTPMFQIYLDKPGEGKAHISPSFGAVLNRSEVAAQAYLNSLKGRPGFEAIANFGAEDLHKYPNLEIADLGDEGVTALLDALDEARD